MTKVINIKSGEPYDVYCGRAGHGQSGEFGNPHPIGFCEICNKTHDREDSLEEYKKYFFTRIEQDSHFRVRILSLENKTLGCFCKEKDREVECHCDTIKEYLENKEKYELKVYVGPQPKYYTGVGSRETPDLILGMMSLIASDLSEKEYILRSGGAEGADSAFENGCDSKLKEIYLPWKKFNENESQLFSLSQEAYDLAAQIHPAWNRLSFGAKKLHARNCYQVLGPNLNNPSKFLICWTKDGKEVGGTRTAIVLAKKYNIPVYNLAIEYDLNDLKKFINDN